MGNVSRQDEEEIIWAKLKGEWDDPSYRYEVAWDGYCLGTLMYDEYQVIAALAIKRLAEREDEI